MPPTPHAVHIDETGPAREESPHLFPGLGVMAVSLSVFQNIMGFVWLIYPACRQHYPDSLTSPRSKRGRCTATRVELIKFIPTNKGMTYPIIQPGQWGHRFPAPARKHTNLITVARPAPITALVARRLFAMFWKGNGKVGLMSFFALDR